MCRSAQHTTTELAGPTKPLPTEQRLEANLSTNPPKQSSASFRFGPQTGRVFHQCYQSCPCRFQCHQGKDDIENTVCPIYSKRAVLDIRSPGRCFLEGSSMIGRPAKIFLEEIKENDELLKEPDGCGDAKSCGDFVLHFSEDSMSKESKDYSLPCTDDEKYCV